MNMKDLEPHQILKVYEGIGWMVSAETDPQTIEKLVNGLL